jgi:hypothetical protein
MSEPEVRQTASAKSGAAICRQCLANLARGPRQVKLPHLLQVLPTEAAPEAGIQICCQTREQVHRSRPVPAALLELDDAPADLPIAGRHQRIDAARGSAAGGLEQRDDVAVDGGVAA